MRFRTNANRFWSCFGKSSGYVFGFATIVLTFVSLDELGFVCVPSKIIALFVLLVISAIAAFVWAIFVSNKRLIWSKSDGSLFACYGDLFKIGRRANEQPLCVIPVNTAFDTQVHACDSSIGKPLVAPNTLHGMWLKRMEGAGLDAAAIDRAIDESLSNTEPTQTLDKSQKERGNLVEYPVGTIARVPAGDATYFLVALSEFDENNMARSGKDNLIRCLEEVLREYDRSGQGNDLYIPLMGTGRSRMGMTHAESLEVTISCCVLHSELIHGNVHIVVHDRDRSKVSIWD